MRCEYCGRQIPENSKYCKYCKSRVSTSTDDCIRPHMPKKHCAGCGKELPGSTISDLCAMCTIRKRNREIEQQRKLEAAKEKQRAASGAARSYDRSDAFDQSVFERERDKYYKEETAERFTEAASHQKRGASGWKFRPPAANGKKKIRYPWVAALVIFLVLVRLVPILVSLFSNFASPKADRPSFSSVDNAAGEDWKKVTTPSHEISIETESGSRVDIEVPFPSEQTPESTPSIGEEEPAPVSTQRDEFIRDYVMPVTHHVLSSWIDAIQWVDYGEIYTDNYYIYIAGTTTTMPEGDDHLEESAFLFCMVMSEQQYLPLMLEWDSEMLFDTRELVSTDGTLALPSGGNLPGLEVGDPLFSAEDLLIQLDELE